MSKLDLMILKEIPQLTVKAELRIEPLAPLSMVSEMPGSFYKTLKQPSQKMICGLFENVLGWHISLKDRKNIQGEIKKIRKKKKIDFFNFSKGSTYVPLLIEYFCLDGDTTVDFLEVTFFDDYWSRCYRRADAVVHPDGTMNIDYRSIYKKWQLKRDDKKIEQVDKKELEAFFKNNLSSFPMYYTSPTIREYVDLRGSFIIPLLMDVKLFDLLSKELQINNVGYLGNSEGWINLKLTKL